MNKLSYLKTGIGGRHIVLLHGYCEGAWVWREIIPLLDQPSTIWAFDLPGFGNSLELPPEPDLGKIAEIFWDEFDQYKITHPVLIGHSLGGYLAMAMSKCRPQKVSGLCLFHSTPFPDGEARQQIRNRVIESVTQSGAKPFLQNFATGLFHQSSGMHYDLFKKLSGESAGESVIFYAKAMRDRPDFSETFRKLNFPILVLAGKYDLIIPPEISEQITALSLHAKLVILAQSAHMGMLEEVSRASAAINTFLKTIG
jgi:pimeloyl-ACP methyl ester carboxylesterase